MGKSESNAGLRGAAAFTHKLKEYGYGKSMEAGVRRLATESKREGFEQGVNYALQRMSVFERLIGRQTKNR